MDNLLHQLSSMRTDDYFFYIEDFYRFHRTGRSIIISFDLDQSVYNTIISRRKKLSFFLNNDVKYLTLRHFEVLFLNYPRIYNSNLYIILLKELIDEDPFHDHEKEYDKLSIIIDHLLENGSDPNKKIYCEYPIYLIIKKIISKPNLKHKLYPLINILLKHGANLDLLTTGGYTIRSYASINNLFDA